VGPRRCEQQKDKWKKYRTHLKFFLLTILTGDVNCLEIDKDLIRSATDDGWQSNGSKCSIGL
jgi:hypothetical protein